jgi:hypothetical protein
MLAMEELRAAFDGDSILLAEGTGVRHSTVAASSVRV